MQQKENVMENKMRKGIVDGVLLALLIILGQPFYPTKGLIPELAAFLTSIPLLIASVIFPSPVSPLFEGGVIIAYFIIAVAVVGIAFERKALWGWFLLIALALHHYVIYEQFGRQMGEVTQTLLNHFS